MVDLESMVAERMITFRSSDPKMTPPRVYSGSCWARLCWSLIVSESQILTCIIWLFWLARRCASAPVMNCPHWALSSIKSMRPYALVMSIDMTAPLCVILNSTICCVLLGLFQPWSVAFLCNLLRKGPSVSVLTLNRSSPSKTGLLPSA